MGVGGAEAVESGAIVVATAAEMERARLVAKAAERVVLQARAVWQVAAAQAGPRAARAAVPAAAVRAEARGVEGKAMVEKAVVGTAGADTAVVQAAATVATVRTEDVMARKLLRC